MIASLENRDSNRLHDALKELLADLSSENAVTRVTIIMQLQPFSAIVEVQDALARRMEVESDAECRYLLSQILDVALPKKTPTTRRNNDDFEIPSGPDEFAQAFRATSESDLEKFLIRLRTFDSEQLNILINNILKDETRARGIYVLLKASQDKCDPDAHQQRLKSILGHTYPLFVLRCYPIILEIEPKVGLTALPNLLLHQSLPIRVMAIRTLHRLYPSEAVRMLGEMTLDEKESVRMMAISLMFAFPFPEIATLLADMLEEGRISTQAFPLVNELVRNNPDKNFLARMAQAYCRRGEEFQEAKPLMKTIVESMALIGMEIGTPGAILSRFIQDARERLSELLSIPILEEVVHDQNASILPQLPEPAIPLKIPSSPKTPINSPSERGTSPESGRSISPSRTETSLSASSTDLTPPPPAAREDKAISSDLSFEKLSALLAAKATPSDIIPLLPKMIDAEVFGKIVEWVEISKTHEPAIIKWFITRLEDSDPRIVISAMNILANKAPKELIPQLPVLCFNQDPLVVNQAIRYYRRLDEKGFLMRLQMWIVESGNRQAWRAALTGAGQMKFSTAKTLVFKALGKIKDMDLIRDFGNILLINPERETVTVLREMAEKESGNRREFYCKLADQCQENLQIVRSVSSPDAKAGPNHWSSVFSGEQMDALLEQIRKIHFSVKETGVASLNDPTVQMYIVLTLCAIFVFWLSSVFFFPSSSGTKRDSNEITGHIPRPTKFPQSKPAGKEPIEGVLLSYDSPKLIWIFQQNDKKTYQIQFPPNARVKVNDRLLIRLEPTGYTFRGRPVYFVRSCQKP